MAFQPLTAAERRITLLAILLAVGGDLDAALEIFTAIADDGRFFEEESASRPTQRQSVPSGRPASSSRPSSRGRDQARGGGQMRDPDGPPSDKQVAFLLRLTDDYTEDEVWAMSKADVSALIEDLK